MAIVSHSRFQSYINAILASFDFLQLVSHQLSYVFRFSFLENVNLVPNIEPCPHFSSFWRHGQCLELNYPSRFQGRKIFGLCSSKNLERLKWNEGNFWSFFFVGQRRTAEFSLVFFLVGWETKTSKLAKMAFIAQKKVRKQHRQLLWGMYTLITVYVHFNRFIDLTISFHRNPYYLASCRLLWVWVPGTSLTKLKIFASNIRFGINVSLMMLMRSCYHFTLMLLTGCHYCHCLLGFIFFS